MEDHEAAKMWKLEGQSWSCVPGVGSLEVPPALKGPPPSARAREAILLPAARLTLLSGT